MGKNALSFVKNVMYDYIKVQRGTSGHCCTGMVHSCDEILAIQFEQFSAIKDIFDTTIFVTPYFVFDNLNNNSIHILMNYRRCLTCALLVWL